MIPEAPAVAAPIEASAPPAAPAAPEPLSASEQAVADNDFNGFKAARHEERFGTPKVAVAVPAKPPVEPTEEPAVIAEAAPVVEPPARTLSNRQQKANEVTRLAVEAATADLQKENARLRAQLAPPPAPRAAAAPDPEPDVANVEKYPSGQFDPKYIKDLSSWQTRQDLKAHTERTADESRQVHVVREFTAAAEASKAIVQAALAADPKALDGIDPRLATLRPTLALEPDELPTFGNVVADWICATQFPVHVMKHLSDPAEQDRLSNLSTAALLREQGRLEAGFALAAKKETPPAPAPPAKVITEAPDPASTLGSRPIEQPDAIESALRAKDQAAYSAAKRAKGVLHFSA